MKNRPILCGSMILIALMAAASPAISQATSGSRSSGFSAGFSLGYLSRALEMNEQTEGTAPKLTSLLASLILRYDFQPGFSLAVHLGYSSSTFDSLVFRRLPFSVDFSSEAGSMGGILVGAEVEKSLLGEEGTFGLGILGQFLASLGVNKEWDLPGLAVERSVKGKPVWMKAAVGPVLSYRGWAGFTPFLFPRFDYLWGTFEINQAVLDLKATESMDLKSKSQFGLGLGADFQPSASLRFRAEAALHPYGGGSDYSFVLQTIFMF